MVVFYLKPTGAICWLLIIDYQKKPKVNAGMSEQIIKHNVHLGINPPLFRQASPPPPVNLRTVQVPLFRQFPLYVAF